MSKQHLQARVFVTFQVPGFHRWPDAPQMCAYLRDLHRHVFHVRVEVYVNHDNRDVEFVKFKAEAEVLFRALGAPYKIEGMDYGDRSCETLAREFFDTLSGYRVQSIEVSEDGENGAVVDAIELFIPRSEPVSIGGIASVRG